MIGNTKLQGYIGGTRLLESMLLSTVVLTLVDHRKFGNMCQLSTQLLPAIAGKTCPAMTILLDI